MTLWQRIRKESGKSVKECADELHVVPATLYKYLSCTKPVPYYVQVYFLRLRGLDIDLINAKYLEERMRENEKESFNN